MDLGPMYLKCLTLRCKWRPNVTTWGNHAVRWVWTVVSVLYRTVQVLEMQGTVYGPPNDIIRRNWVVLWSNNQKGVEGDGIWMKGWSKRV